MFLYFIYILNWLDIFYNIDEKLIDLSNINIIFMNKVKLLPSKVQKNILKIRIIKIKTYFNLIKINKKIIILIKISIILLLIIIMNKIKN